MNGSRTLKLLTKRLELTAATMDHVCAELEAPESLAALLNARAEPGWPPGEYDRNAQEFFLNRLKEGGMSVVGWYCWYAVLHESAGRPSVLVGAGGYFGPPDEKGEVEIGFSIMPAWQGAGYATETARALIENAFNDVRVKKVVAHAAPENPASCRVLEKCGFRRLSLNEESGNHRFEILQNSDGQQ